MPHSFTLIVFLRENELFQRGWGVFVTIVEIPEGWGGHPFPAKMENPGGWGVLSEISSVVGVWIFSGTTHCNQASMPSGLRGRLTTLRKNEYGPLVYTRFF